MIIKNILQKFLGISLVYCCTLIYADNLDSKWILSPNGLGPIQIGMDLAEVEKITHRSFTSIKPEPDMAEDEGCFNTTLVGIENISFMVSYNKIVRININAGTTQTAAGAHIGTPEKDLQKLYANQLVSEKHHYDAKGQYFTLIQPANDRALRFETDGEKVVRIYAGQSKPVHYIEDCL